MILEIFCPNLETLLIYIIDCMVGHNQSLVCTGLAR